MEGWGFIQTGALDQALMRALSVLVAACPCAVGLALPLAYATATATAARQGVLFRDPAAMEALGGARSVLFDKTGTLTAGELELGQTIGGERGELLAWAAQAEAGIVHPMARAIQSAAQAAGAAPPPSGSAPQRFGRGTLWRDPDNGEITLVGSAAFLEEQGVNVPASFPLVDGASRVEVARGGLWAGALILRDCLRPDAAEAVATLRRAGLGTSMVTGDRCETAEAVAAAIGLMRDQVRAGCLTEDKVAALHAAPGPTVFVGDGVNDSLALAAADCGIAVQDASAPAMASAGVVITQGGLAAVVLAWSHSRRTMRIVRQNLVFSIVYNGGVLLLAAGGIIPPVAAAVAMLCSSLSVVANSARLSIAKR